jgi:hypothetical protein
MAGAFGDMDLYVDTSVACLVRERLGREKFIKVPSTGTKPYDATKMIISVARYARFDITFMAYMYVDCIEVWSGHLLNCIHDFDFKLLRNAFDGKAAEINSIANFADRHASLTNNYQMEHETYVLAEDLNLITRVRGMMVAYHLPTGSTGPVEIIAPMEHSSTNKRLNLRVKKYQNRGFAVGNIPLIFGVTAPPTAPTMYLFPPPVGINDLSRRVFNEHLGGLAKLARSKNILVYCTPHEATRPWCLCAPNDAAMQLTTHHPCPGCKLTVRKRKSFPTRAISGPGFCYCSI